MMGIEEGKNNKTPTHALQCIKMDPYRQQRERTPPVEIYAPL
jgi:hypothetical protein